MRLKHKVNIFLENKKWLNKKIFKSEKSIDNFISYLSQITINECFLQPKFKKFKNLKTNINFILADDRLLKKLNTNFLNNKKTTNELTNPNENFFKNKIGHLIVHGTLHLLGYDHKTKIDEKKMINIESKILNSLDINYY